MTNLRKFLEESNAIEGIFTEISGRQLRLTQGLLDNRFLRVSDLENFVNTFEPGARLRAESHMNVRVGDYYPPQGGKNVIDKLNVILEDLRAVTYSPWQVHVDYELLHPFMDCNGRSGRILWLWKMQFHGLFPKDFLKTFYRQTLFEKGQK